MNSRTKVAVVGAGFFGQYHARNYAAMPDVELVAVVDRDGASARSLAAETGCAPLSDHRELVGKVDAVSVVVPTVHHAAVAGDFLRAGIATLVEKPLALSLDEARAMTRLAAAHGAMLQVGHVERFNPVWKVVEELPDAPIYLETRRSSPFPFRSLDVSVVMDVMIHDLDLVLAAAGGRVDSVRAVGRRSVSAQADRAEVDLLFASGCRAHLSASRAHPRSERTLRWWNEDATIELDFFRKTSATLRRRPGVRQVVEPKGMLAPAERERMLAETFAVETREHDQTVHPLRLELDDFIRCARTGARPKVGGEEGLAALALAHRIEQAMSEQSAGEGSLSRAA